MSSLAEATKLKEKGNKLFAQKDYNAAAHQYTRAIERDGSNAVLYANRAACHQLLKLHEKSLEDALKATELNPSYVKGWWRAAEAYDSIGWFTDAAHSWKSAIEALPAELTPAQDALLEKFTAAMMVSRGKVEDELLEKARRDSGGSSGLVINLPFGRAPWEVVVKKAPELHAAGNTTSCVWVMMHAQAAFESGIEDLKQKNAPIGTTMLFMGTNKAGYPVPQEALVTLSNALTTDGRAVHMEDFQYTDMLQRMIRSEIIVSRAPDPAEKFEATIASFRRMLAEHGWDRVRPAVTITVRALIVRGDMSVGLRRDYETGFLVLNKAMRILSWGRVEWAGVSDYDRGMVFTDTFYAAVARITLIAYEQAYLGTYGRSRHFQLSELLERAEALIEHAQSIKEVPSDHVGVWNAYVVYPEALGHSVKARALGGYVSSGLCRDDERTEYTRQAMQSYLTAARLYPEDDEYHVLNLHNALNFMFILGTPLRETLPVMERMRNLTPDIMEIWEYSALMQTSLAPALKKVAIFEEEVRIAMEMGRPGYGLEDLVRPAWAQLAGI